MILNTSGRNRPITILLRLRQIPELFTFQHFGWLGLIIPTQFNGAVRNIRGIVICPATGQESSSRDKTPGVRDVIRDITLKEYYTVLLPCQAFLRLYKHPLISRRTSHFHCPPKIYTLVISPPERGVDTTRAFRTPVIPTPFPRTPSVTSF